MMGEAENRADAPIESTVGVAGCSLMPRYAKQLEWIDAQQGRMTRLVCEWSAINSGTGNVPGIQRQAAALVKEYAGLGGDLREIPLPPRQIINHAGQPLDEPVGHALSIIKRPDAPLRVLLGIHMDTVYGPDDPFQACEQIDANTVRGPGVADAKGGLVVMLIALEALEQSVLAGAIGWEVLINPDEEVGSVSSGYLFAQAAKRNHLGLLFEPALPDGSLVSSRKGSGNFTVVVRGRSAHAGRDFHVGRNAIVAMTELIRLLDSLNGRHPGITLNVGQVEGGGAVNVVPDLAICRFNVRATDPSQQRLVETHVREAVNEIARRDGITLMLHGGFSSPPKPLDSPTQRLLDHLRACGQEMNLPIQWKASGGASDGNRLAAAGLPTVDSLGVRGGEIHSANEFIHLDSLAEREADSALSPETGGRRAALGHQPEITCMTPLVAESFRNDTAHRPRCALVLEALSDHQRQITGIRPADPERKVSYGETLRAFTAMRGGSLYYPYLGTGIGRGPLVELGDGSIKYDMISGIGVHYFGHSHPMLIEAGIDAALSDTVMEGNLQQDADSVAFSKLLLDTACKNCAALTHCFLTATGATANENALKIIFQKHSPAHRLLAFEHCFAGRTLALAQITDKAGYRVGLPSILNVDYVPFFDATNPEQSTGRALAALRDHLQRCPHQHAAMIFELVQGEGGYYAGQREFFVALMDELRKHHVAIMIDEIQTFGRTPEPFAFQHFGLDAYVDVVTVGKLTQACATLFREEYTPQPNLISQTFTASTSAIFAGRAIVRGARRGQIFWSRWHDQSSSPPLRQPSGEHCPPASNMGVGSVWPGGDDCVYSVRWGPRPHQKNPTRALRRRRHRLCGRLVSRAHPFPHARRGNYRR